MSAKKPTKKPSFVIDTNVLLTASGKASHHSNDECKLEAAKFLHKIQGNKILIHLDESGDILKEYRKKSSTFKDRRAGDEFLRYLIQNAYRKNLVDFVRVEKDEQENHIHFPADPDLRKFDNDDRKFVAVAIASNREPEIVNAGDSRSWENYKNSLQKYVKLKFLCK